MARSNHDALETIARALNRAEGASWLGTEAATLLVRLFKFEPGFSAGEQLDIVRRTVAVATSTAPVTARELQSSFAREQEAQRRIQRVPVVVLTTILLPPSLLARHPIRAKHSGCLILAGNLPRRFINQAMKSVEWLLHQQETKRPFLTSMFSPVMVILHARNADTAVDTAKLALDAFRANLNYCVNLQTHRRWDWSGSHDVVNCVVLGDVTVCLRRDGSVAYRGYWRSQLTVERLAKRLARRRSRHGWTEVASNALAVDDTITRHCYPDVMRQAMIRYVRALDDHDLEACFLKLWSLLEFLTCTDDSRKVIDRALSRWDESERDFQRLILESLRGARNRFVHASIEVTAVDWAVYQCKEVVEELLRFHLGCVQGSPIDCIGNAMEYLDLSLESSDELRARSRMIETVLGDRARESTSFAP